MPTRTAALAYSPDGKTLVSGGYDKVVKFWNPATGELIRTLSGHTGWVVSLAFSHDGQTLASGSLRPLDPAVERGRRPRAASLGRPHGDGSLAGLFARRQAPGQRQRRPDRAAVGRRPAARSKPVLSGHEAGVRSVAFSPRRSAAGLGRRRSGDPKSGTSTRTIYAARSPATPTWFRPWPSRGKRWSAPVGTTRFEPGMPTRCEQRRQTHRGPQRGGCDGGRPRRPPTADRQCRPIADPVEVNGDCVAIRYKMTRSNPMDTRDTELIQDACLKRETTGL